MKPPLRAAAGAALALAAGVLGLVAAAWSGPADTHRHDAWTAAGKATLASMQLSRLAELPADPSNAVEARAEAVALGRRLFSDTRLSGNGQVACASCHDPQREFQDGRPVGQGAATGRRRTMPIAAAGHGPWLFWDGRKDSLWSQALGPLEDAAEHGANRVQLVRLLGTQYRAEYEALFGPFPSLQDLPVRAGPLGSRAEREAWAAMPPAQRESVNRTFANLGKAIAAYERTIRYEESRFDRYVAAVLRGDAAGQQVLSAQEVAGLRVFIGPGQCATCHNGPLLTDQHFHNTGVPPRDPSRPDRGRVQAVAAVLADEFNCRGIYSDDPRASCAELDFLATDDAAMEGAFKTPSLRHVAGRAPYMHAGQFGTLEEVVAHYRRAPVAATGRSELLGSGSVHAVRVPIRLTDAEACDLVAFLRSLGPAPAP